MLKSDEGMEDNIRVSYMSSAVFTTSQVTRPSATMETICAATIDMVPLFLEVFLVRLLVLVFKAVLLEALKPVVVLLEAVTRPTGVLLLSVDSACSWCSVGVGRLGLQLVLFYWCPSLHWSRGRAGPWQYRAAACTTLAHTVVQ